MMSLLETDRHPALTGPTPRRRLPRWVRWVVGIAAGALFASALGYLIADQGRAHGEFGRAQTALGVTRQRTDTVKTELAEVRRDLSLLETQVGTDTTALSQDASQLLGAQTSLAAAKAHVTQQASLITSLQTCLGGVEQALNALAVGAQAKAIAALNSVSSSCTAAEAAGG
jgi:hypothetical protein